jgi:hypothetical protein
MPQRAAGLGGGAGLAAFVILWRLTAHARPGGILDPKGCAAGRTRDSSVLVLQGSISDPKDTAASPAEPNRMQSARCPGWDIASLELRNEARSASMNEFGCGPLYPLAAFDRHRRHRR